MRYTIGERNWLTELGEAVQEAEPGDVIEVASEAARELAEAALERNERSGVSVVVRLHVDLGAPRTRS